MSVTCETCDESTFSNEYPCSNCNAFPPARDWDQPLQFEEALWALRLGKRVRRKGWDAYVEKRAGPERLEMVGRRGSCTYRASSDELLAEDWEIAT